MTLTAREIDFQEDATESLRGQFVAAFKKDTPPPFVLRETEDEGLLLLEDIEVAVYGSGPNREAALQDFLQAASSHLAILESEPRLSPRLEKQRDYLRERLPFA